MTSLNANGTQCMNIIDILREVNMNQGVKSKVVVLLFRLATWYSPLNSGKMFRFLFFPFFILNKIFNEFIFCVEIPYCVNIGFGLKIYHPHSIVINKNARLGKNCILRQNVTIGNALNSDGLESLSPLIGDSVEIGAQVTIIGNVKIGNNCRIGAGSIVTKNLSDNTTVVSFGFRELVK